MNSKTISGIAIPSLVTSNDRLKQLQERVNSYLPEDDSDSAFNPNELEVIDRIRFYAIAYDLTDQQVKTICNTARASMQQFKKEKVYSEVDSNNQAGISRQMRKAIALLLEAAIPDFKGGEKPRD